MVFENETAIPFCCSYVIEFDKNVNSYPHNSACILCATLHKD